MTETPLEIQKYYPDFLVQKMSTRIWTQLSDRHQWQAVAVGPGLGVTAKSKKILQKILQDMIRQKRKTPLVLDADALNLISSSVLLMKLVQKHGQCILTPHPGEWQRLLKLGQRHFGVSAEVEKTNSKKSKSLTSNSSESTLESSAVISANVGMQQIARNFSRQCNCILVIKGPKTLVATPQSAKIYRNMSGNAALAKAGTGDVLTGIIVGLLAQKVEPSLAARLGVYLHGLLADYWLQTGHSQLSLLPSDLTQMLPVVLKKIQKGKFHVS
jgi:NAD(P)H-hydrate epimerase